MNVAEFLSSLNIFDLLVVLFLFGMFVLGYRRGRSGGSSGCSR